jgi:outer membrane protein assembly factor BamB
VQYRFPFGMRGPTVNAATPLVLGDHLFVTASYGIGAVCAHPGKTEAKIVWQNDAISSQYASSLYLDGVLYGCDGRADDPPGHLKALDAKTGKTLWTEQGFGIAHLVAADGKALALKDDGTLVLFKPSKEKFEQLATAKILEGTTRAIPALSNGKLYARDTEILKCWSVGTK